MLCGSAGCGCAFESSTLNISIGPEGQIILEQAEFTDITALQADVASLQASRTTDEANIATLQTSDATNTASIARFDTMGGGSVLQSAAGVGPTTSTTSLTVCTVSLSAFGQAGTLHWGGHAYYTKTVVTDTFRTDAVINGTSRARFRDSTQIASGQGIIASSIAILAADTPIISVIIGRESGTGTATTVASTVAGGLWWSFLPN